MSVVTIEWCAHRSAEPVRNEEMVVTTEWLADHLGKIAILEIGDSAATAWRISPERWKLE